MGRLKKEVKRLIAEQKRDMKREKHHPRQYSEIITPKKHNPLLPRHKRFIIYGLHRAGFSTKNIAAYFKLTKRTVRYHIQRAKENLAI